MAAAVESGPGVEGGASALTRYQKLAVLLVVIGPDGAAEVLKHLSGEEVEALSVEMAKLSVVRQELQLEILKEFSEVALQAGTALRGGSRFAKAVLEKAVGPAKATDILSKVTSEPPRISALDAVIEMDARQIYNLLKHEQAQTVALIAGYLPPQKASQVLAFFPSDFRADAVERLATLGATPIEVVEKVVSILIGKQRQTQSGPFSRAGGVKNAADLLNALNKDLSKPLLVSLEERNPELGKAIRQKMFTFEDLAALSAAALQKIMREVDTRDLAVALKAATDKQKAALLGCISKRAAETVREEMGFMAGLKLKEIEAAQMRIIEVARRLESEGEIELEGSESTSKNEALV
jgi:flagellar motor switch protein FliG